MAINHIFLICLEVQYNIMEISFSGQFESPSDKPLSFGDISVNRHFQNKSSQYGAGVGVAGEASVQEEIHLVLPILLAEGD